MPKVFISYSHDSPDHRARVLALANRLRGNGIDCMIDQYIVVPPEGWPRWMDREICQAEFVLLVCTKTYFRRVMGEEQKGKGLGVRWEGRLIFQHIYNAGTTNTKFIPILFESGTRAHVPTPLQSTTFYAVHTDEGYEDLYRRLTNQPRPVPPELGKLRGLPPCEAMPEGTLGNLHSAADLTPSLLRLADGIVCLSDCEIDAQMAVTLVAEASNLGSRDAIVDSLVAEVPKREDPTERYWIYTALGEIGGHNAAAALSQGIADPDEFARQGATDALGVLSRILSSNTKKQSRRWWVFATSGIVLLCAGVMLLKLLDSSMDRRTNPQVPSPSSQPPTSILRKVDAGNPAPAGHVVEIRWLDGGQVELRHNTPDGQSLSIIMSVPHADEQLFLRFATTF
ncbi:MAG: SEFIR domain-containing protein [Limisphaerales bacterium]